MLPLLLFLGLAVGPASPAMIIGGSIAKFGEFPFMCYMVTPTEYCSCVYIGSYKVLTAAHCITAPADSISVYMGNPIVSEMMSSSIYHYWVSKAIQHHSFIRDGLFNDIAILILWKDPKPSKYQAIAPIPIANRYDGSFERRECTIVGYGRINDGADFEELGILFKASTPVISNTECSRFWRRVVDKSICAYKPGHGACKGDSGGALVCDGKLAGIVSYGKADCSTLMPTVFARVSEYFTWIRSHH